MAPSEPLKERAGIALQRRGGAKADGRELPGGGAQDHAAAHLVDGDRKFQIAARKYERFPARAAALTHMCQGRERAPLEGNRHSLRDLSSSLEPLAPRLSPAPRC